MSRPLAAVITGLFLWNVLFETAVRGDEDPIAAAFNELDTDGNHKLTLEEYLAQPGNQKQLARDFRVFDFDGDGFLTLAEFSAIPGLVPPHQRGAIPDPMDGLLEAAIEAMDESYGNWSRQPDRKVPAQTFVIEFMGSLSPDGRRTYDPSLRALADANNDGQVTWDEAKRFLEIQLGIRWKTGHLIRQPNGRILMMRHFLWRANDEGVIERRYFIEENPFSWVKEDQAELFDRGDLNGDGLLSLDEYAHPEWVGYEDVVATFLRMDTNYDGFLDDEEIRASAGEYQELLVPSTVPAFDLDGDGKLSLQEFRMSMMGNKFVSWHSKRTDRDRDKQLSFEEFTFDNVDCHLLRRYYFHRLDRDGDGKLSLDEFTFNIRPPNTLHTMAADGSDFRLLYRNEEYPNCGSPKVSPDGKTIAFDGYPGGVTIRDSRILLIDSDGGRFRDLCEGLMPTWSRDGKQLACSRYRDGSGVWIVNIDGTDDKRIDDGWGAQWSTDGKTIAYTKGNALMAYDVETGQIREALPQGDHDFRSIYYNMNWSPDSSRLAFKARTQNDYALASIDMAGDDPDLQVHFSTNQNFEANLAWAPDGRRILFTMRNEELKRHQLFELDSRTNDPPRLIEGPDENISYLGGVAFTRDGERIILVTRE
jgi:TolB protein